MTDIDKEEIKTIAKDIVKNLNSCFTEQLRKHNIHFNNASLLHNNFLLKKQIAKELIDPHPDDISHLTVIIEDYVRDCY